MCTSSPPRGWSGVDSRQGMSMTRGPGKAESLCSDYKCVGANPP